MAPRPGKMASKRTSFNFSKEAMAQLEAIRERTVFDDETDIVRIALSAYDELLGLTETRHKILIRDRDGQPVKDDAGNELAYSPHKKFVYRDLAKFPQPSDEAVRGTRESNFYFSGEAVDRIESIKERSWVKTNADAIRIALTAYKTLIMLDEAGDRIIVRGSDGTEHDYSPYRPFKRMTGSEVRAQ